MATQGQVFGAPQVSGASPLTTGHVWVGSSSLAVDTAPTGSGSPVFSNTPTLVTPVLGAATATSINFGGTTLANYVEGSWTPTIVGGTTPGTGQSYTSQTGQYERIGRLVIASFNLIVSGVGTASGLAQIGGLPIAAVGSAGWGYLSGYSVTGLTVLTYGIVCSVASGGSVINLLSNGNTAISNITIAQCGSTPFFQGTLIYRVS